MGGDLRDADGVVARHGESKYEQKVVTLDEANDLTPAGEANVIRYSAEVMGKWQGFPRVRIFSSDYGRAGHTAKIWQQVARSFSFEADLSLSSQLEEVEGLDFKLLCALVSGGQYNGGFSPVTFDARKTNPNGLDYRNYFMQGFPVPKDVDLPDSVRQRIQETEKYGDIVRRFSRFMGTLRVHRGKSKLVIVTHQALTEELAKQAGIEAGLVPGGYIGFRWNGDGLVTVK